MTVDAAALTEKLAAAAVEARELLSEVRGSIKDLRQAERDAHHAKAELEATMAAAARAAVDDQIRDAVRQAMDGVGDDIERLAGALYDGLTKNVTKLYDLLMGKADTPADLRVAIERRVGTITGRGDELLGTLPRRVYRATDPQHKEDIVVHHEGTNIRKILGLEP